MNLTQWQRKQAALLYHFSSMKYLEGLLERVKMLRVFANDVLDVNEVQGRDKLLRSKRWGSRNTGENWENNAWPFLGDFQRSVARDIADRKSNIYHKTGAYQCVRGISEFSLQWMAPEEQDEFDRRLAEVSRYAENIDDTMDRAVYATRWNDFGLTIAWQEHAHNFPILPKFVAKPEMVCESGHIPPKTGVYVSIDDPNATLQFGWTGSDQGKLLDSTTLNDLGKHALASVGRAKLWIDGDAMLRFVLANLSCPDLVRDPFFDESQTPDLAPALVAGNAFESKPSRWCFVELVKDEFEQIEDEVEEARPETLRFGAGDDCLREGFYFSPADPNSRRHFRVGEQFPVLNPEYGKTIWQWDSEQGGRVT